MRTILILLLTLSSTAFAGWHGQRCVVGRIESVTPLNQMHEPYKMNLVVRYDSMHSIKKSYPINLMIDSLGGAGKIESVRTLQENLRGNPATAVSARFGSTLKIFSIMKNQTACVYAAKNGIAVELNVK